MPIVRCIMVVQPLLTGTIISPRRSESQSSTTDYDHLNQENGRKDGEGLRRNRTNPALGLSNPTGDSSVVTDANSPTNTQPDFMFIASLSMTMTLTRNTGITIQYHDKMEPRDETSTAVTPAPEEAIRAHLDRLLEGIAS